MRFEYKTTFFPVEYRERENGVWILKANEIARDPDEASLLASEDYQEHLHEMGNQGFELVSVQPLLRGVFTLVGTGGFGYPLTAGYYFFWKKTIE